MNITISQLLEAAQNRHSVRQFVDRPIDSTLVAQLAELIARINTESGLHIQLITNEPLAFSTGLAKLGNLTRYGRFEGCSNYLVVAGNTNINHLDEVVGYYGEQVVLYAQALGLNTCWAGLTYATVPHTFALDADEKVICYIALGYGTNQGRQHTMRDRAQLSNCREDDPEWFVRGVEMAMLAPTAVNQQKYYIHGERDAEGRLTGVVRLQAKGLSLNRYKHVDLGIVRYHFELGAQPEHFRWKLEQTQ